MPSRNHIVITGTGRAGTTFLVELLTHLGLETGYNTNDLVLKKHTFSHCGLEHDIRKDNCPYIVKSPWFCDYAHEVLLNNDIAIEHIFVPMRNLHGAAESRRFVSRQNVEWGGLWHTQSYDPGIQENILLNQVYKLFLAISGTMIPVTVIQYPKSINDCSYLFHKLKPVLHGIAFDFFSSKFITACRPDLVHSYNENDT